MRSRVRLGLPDGTQVELGHGDLVGRLWSAALCLDDPRISEAHAVVSLRGHELKLLALRGRFSVHGRTVSELALRAGQRVELAHGLTLDVLAVEVPTEVLGVRAAGARAQVLPGACALAVDPPRITRSADPSAVAHLWPRAGQWRARVGAAMPFDLDPGTTFDAGGATWEAVLVPLVPATAPTELDPTLAEPLHVVARYDTVHLFRPTRTPAQLSGLSARLVSELVAFGQPVHWEVLSGELWPDGGSRKQLDMALVRLRRHLREQHVRSDLVRATGVGTLELFLRPGDRVEDQQ